MFSGDKQGGDKLLVIFILFAISAIILGIMQRSLAPQMKRGGLISEADNEILRNEIMRKKAESIDGGMTALEYEQRQNEVGKNANANRNVDIPKPIYAAERLKSEAKQPMRSEATEPKASPAAKPRLDPYSGSEVKSRLDSYSGSPNEKPLVAHSTADCTGGSIHDGYHEGTARKPIEAAQREGTAGRQGRVLKGKDELHKQGVPLPGENHSVRYAPETVPVSAKPSGRTGADKLVAAIAKKPSIVQGVIWGEILGKPKSEIG